MSHIVIKKYSVEERRQAVAKSWNLIVFIITSIFHKGNCPEKKKGERIFLENIVMGIIKQYGKY